MKKIIAVTMCVIMMLSSVAHSAYAAQIVTGEFSSAFESLSNLTSAINYNITQGGGWALTAAQNDNDYIDVVSDSSAQGSYLDAVASASSTFALRYYPTNDITTTADIKMDIRLSDRNAERRLIWYDSEGHNSRVGVITKSNGKFQLFGVSNVVTFDLNVWYEIHIKYNFENEYYIWTITNKSTNAVSTGEGFYTGHYLVDLDHIRYFVPNSCTAVSHLYLDNLGVNTSSPVYKDFMNETTFTSSSDLSGYTVSNPASASVSSDGLCLATSSSTELTMAKEFDMGMYGSYRFETVLGKFTGDAHRSIKLGNDEIVAFSDGNIYCGSSNLGAYSDAMMYSVVIKADTSDKGVDVEITPSDSAQSLSASTTVTTVPLDDISVCILPDSSSATSTNIQSLNCYSDFGMLVISSNPDNGATNISPSDIKLTFTNPIGLVNAVKIGDNSFSDYEINPNKRNELTLNTASVLEYDKSYSIPLMVTDIFGASAICTLTLSTKPAYEFGDIAITSSGANTVAKVSGISNDGNAHSFDLILAQFDSASGRLTNLTSSQVNLTSSLAPCTAQLAYSDSSYYEAYLWDDIKTAKAILSAASFGTPPELSVNSAASGYLQNMDTGVVSATGLGMTGEHKTFVVLAPGCTPDSIDGAATLTDVIEYISQFDNLSQDSFAFTIAGGGGKYGTMVNSAFTADAIDYIDVAHINAALAAINSPSLDIAAAVAGYNDVLCVDARFLSSLTSAELDWMETQIISYKNELPLQTFNVETFSVAYYKALCAAMIKYADNADDVKAVFDNYSSHVATSGFETYSTYNALTTDAKNTLYVRMSQNDITSFDDIKNLFNDSVILAAVKHAEYQLDAGKVIKDNASYMQLSLANYNLLSNTGAVNSAIMGKDYTDISSLKTAFNAAVTNQYNLENINSQSPGVISGGGSSSSSNQSFALPAETVTPTDTSAFSDIFDYAWAKEAIEYLSSASIISGRANGIFAPSDNIKREEFAKIAVLAFADISNASPSQFADVSPDAWYAPYVASATHYSLVNGMGDGSFGVGNNITREDIAVILYRAAAANSISLASAQLTFTDNHLISEYAKEAVSALAGSGIINGSPDGSFNPKAYATRAEAAKMVYAILVKGGGIK